jgi:hypothetical protein
MVFLHGISKFFSCLAWESARKWWITPCKTIYGGETEKCAKHNGELMNIFYVSQRATPTFFVVICSQSGDH